MHARLEAREFHPSARPFQLRDLPETDVRFFMCRNPDGTTIQFIDQEVAQPQLLHININYSNLVRSSDSHQKVLGLHVLGRSRPDACNGEGFGLRGDVRWEAGFLTLSEGAA